jgi:hypothetical protein
MKAEITLFERATVSGYGQWRKAFDAFRSELAAMGVVGSTVFQSADDPNDITVAHDFASLAEARAFVASNELHAARPAAGVSTPPTLWFTRRVT